MARQRVKNHVREISVLNQDGTFYPHHLDTKYRPSLGEGEDLVWSSPWKQEMIATSSTTQSASRYSMFVNSSCNVGLFCLCLPP